MYITFTSTKQMNKAKPTLALNPEETSPEIQDRGTSGPKIGHYKLFQDQAGDIRFITPLDILKLLSPDLVVKQWFHPIILCSNA